MSERESRKVFSCKEHVVYVGGDVGGDFEDDDDDVDQNLKCPKDVVECLDVLIARNTLICISAESKFGGNYHRQGPIANTHIHTALHCQGSIDRYR